MNVTKIITSIITIILVVVFVKFLWIPFSIILVIAAIFFGWTYFRAKKTIKQWQGDGDSLNNQEYEDHDVISGDVIDAEYKEKEIK